MSEENFTIEKMIQKVEKASSTFEKTNTELKRKFLIWNIEAFNIIASHVSVNKGTFGTGYPFYVLDKNLEGKLPIISEQIRYNRELIRNGEPFQKSIWLCKPCLDRKYSKMPDLKKICKPCPNMIDKLKPRKLINRLPDLDMWLICEDGKIEIAENELKKLLEFYGMRPSDKDPMKSIEDISEISEMLKNNIIPKIFLPIDTHIVEYSEIKKLIKKLPEELRESKKEGRKPYLPIHPISYRKQWQYDDEAYNFIYDYLSAFTAFNIQDDLQKELENSRYMVSTEFESEELFQILLNSATISNNRRFHTPELEDIFIEKVEQWKMLKNKSEKNDEDEISR